MNLNTWEISKRFTLVINLMMNIYNMHKKYMKNGQEQVLYILSLDIRRNVKKETATERDKLP